jgi:hypothetical protein
MVSELKVIYPKNKLKILEKKIDENNNSMQLNIDYLLTDTKGRNFYGVSSIKVWSNISAKIKFFKKLESENNVKMEKEKIFFATNQISIF